MERYLTPEYMHFKSARLILNTKMQVGDAVDRYVAQMQYLAKTVKADEKMVRYAILNGLLPHISNYVAQQQPKTVPEFLQAARIAELTTPVANEMNSGCPGTVAETN